MDFFKKLTATGFKKVGEMSPIEAMEKAAQNINYGRLIAVFALALFLFEVILFATIITIRFAIWL